MVVLQILRLGLQVVLFFLLLSVVVGLASADTGLVEKLALLAVGAVLIYLSSLVRRICAPSPPRPA